MIDAERPPGDAARATVLVRVEPAVAFRVFTEEIDRWWRRGLAYRVGGRGGVLRLEPGVGGRLLETIPGPEGERVVHSGTVTRWEPPTHLSFEWRAVVFEPGETTLVDVAFAPSGPHTLVTVTHGGWSTIRPDHPARHGLEPAAFVRSMGLWWGELLGSYRSHAAR